MLSKNAIKSVQELHSAKGRANRGMFIAEGVKITEEIMNERPEMVHTIYATTDFFTPQRRGRMASFQTEIVTQDELSRISLQQSPNQVVTVCRAEQSHDVKKMEDRFAFYLDDIRDPGNFGTIVRLCSWFGIRQLYCSPSCCELYNPKVIQSTMGAFLRVKVSYSTIGEVMEKNPGVSVYGASASGKNIFETMMQQGLIVIGNEAHGLSDDTAARVSDLISIPHPSGNTTESLNAAMAASIICAEFYRQLSR
jgi:RNA methyltransferase, TrmH family